MKKIIQNNLWLSSVVIAIIVGYAIGFLSIYFFEEYGWTVFTVVPFALGLVPSLIYGTSKEMSRTESIKIGFASLGIFCATTLFFALEGIICIIMAAPILGFSTLLGALAGFQIIKSNINNKQIYSIAILPLVVLFIDTTIDSSEFLEVKTAIEIDAPIEEVWHNVISFGAIEEPKDWFFKTGISYPTHAEIIGEGVGAVRYCNFTTGSFVEPITVWEAPTLLKFDVQDQPTPMRELNPFWDVHPPHLDGYFQSKKGQFKLKVLENGSTLIEGTTWYNIHIHPIEYWDFWSKYILHKIHYRVLEHIKEESGS